ncbi:MAG TPA: GNAT family N-acetyltransferase [Acidimicrobiia bacterium]|nr:GNAT family N-acetyltransferase [Acidimicrobiia bacterium]
MTTTDARSSLGDLGPAWDALVDVAPLPSPFLRSWWLDGVAGPNARFVVVRDGDDLIGGAAFEEDRPLGVRRLRPVGMLLGADQLDLVAALDREEEVVEALREWVRDRRAGLVDLVGCYEQARLPAVLDRPSIEVVEPAPWTPLPSSFSDFMASRPGALRGQIRGPNRRLRREGASHRLVELDDSARALADLRRLHAQLFGVESQFLPEFDRFARAAPAGIARGELVMHEFVVDDRPVAVNVCFEVAGRVCFYQGGRDVDRRWRGSGTALLALCVEHAMGNGCREFDLMRGDHGYKRLWADETRDILRVSSVRGLAGRLASLALPAGRRVRSLGRRIARRRSARGGSGDR